jgi:CheY-like chemotaxis protein
VSQDGSVRAAGPRPETDHALVLIAEDEEPIADALAFIVADAGYIPVQAAHGREALEIARARHPALVITDLMMPHLSGTDLILALRDDAAREGYRPPPIILMTAAGHRLARATGADAVLRKPFDIGEVEDMLHRYLGDPPGPQGG